MSVELEASVYVIEEKHEDQFDRIVHQEGELLSGSSNGAHFASVEVVGATKLPEFDTALKRSVNALHKLAQFPRPTRKPSRQYGPHAIPTGTRSNLVERRSDPRSGGAHHRILRSIRFSGPKGQP